MELTVRLAENDVTCVYVGLDDWEIDNIGKHARYFNMEDLGLPEMPVCLSVRRGKLIRLPEHFKGIVIAFHSETWRQVGLKERVARAAVPSQKLRFVVFQGRSIADANRIIDATERQRLRTLFFRDFSLN